MKKQKLLNFIQRQDPLRLQAQLIDFVKEYVQEGEIHTPEDKKGVPYKDPTECYILDYCLFS